MNMYGQRKVKCSATLNYSSYMKQKANTSLRFNILFPIWFNLYHLIYLPKLSSCSLCLFCDRFPLSSLCSGDKLRKYTHLEVFGKDACFFTHVFSLGTGSNGNRSSMYAWDIRQAVRVFVRRLWKSRPRADCELFLKRNDKASRNDAHMSCSSWETWWI